MLSKKIIFFLILIGSTGVSTTAYAEPQISKIMEKTIMLVVNQGFSARYLLRSKIFDILKKSGLKIVILSPAAFDKNFTQEFSGDKIFHELYRPQKYRVINSKGKHTI